MIKIILIFILGIAAALAYGAASKEAKLERAIFAGGGFGAWNRLLEGSEA